MSFFSKFNPVPAFPAYSGPYSVGTSDVEIPANELSVETAHGIDSTISTINFRLFYPCNPHRQKSKAVYWLPSPQGEYLRSYARFMQASPWLASLLSYIPFTRLIFHAIIPAYANAPLLKLAESNPKIDRWPVLIFSHGLGGSKNAYSQICGSLASYGIVVATLDHRDGSAPVSFVRKTSTTGAQRIDNRKVETKGSEKSNTDKRDQMLRIRCWELGLLHSALLKLDQGSPLTNLASEDNPPPPNLTSSLDVYIPGRIAWAGHSFGAACILQFLKCVFYSSSILLPPSVLSRELKTQITPSTPSFFLDLWALPIYSPATTDLLAHPLPCYTSLTTAPTTSHTTNNRIDSPLSPEPSGTAKATVPVSILSSSFYDWKSNTQQTISLLSPPSTPSASIPSPLALSQDFKLKPLIFYPQNSAHLSQSDFGLLFPRITRRALGAQEPERTMLLNVRAVIEGCRRCGWTVARTSSFVLEEDDDGGEGGSQSVNDVNKEGYGKGRDWRILSPKTGLIRGWIPVDADVKEHQSGLASQEKEKDAAGSKGSGFGNGEVEGDRLREVKKENNDADDDRKHEKDVPLP